MSLDSPEVEDTTYSQTLSLDPRFDFPFDRKQLIDADDTLRSCLSAVIDKSELPDHVVAYFFR